MVVQSLSAIQSVHQVPELIIDDTDAKVIEKKREDAHTGLATLCIGGGQGQALIVKK